ncbi:MAG: protein kinase [Planctomycetes bacterium]|nr:protein kinase [Planctomycetota bacterium]
MPRLLVEKGPDRGKTLSVTGHAPVTVGRDVSADLQLSDIMSSRKHFMIGCKGSVFGLKDLESANGTLVNGRKAEGPMRLTYGDSIQVGETLLSWLADEQQAKAGGLIGHVIGGYRIEERLGRGAMGTVYKAIQLSLGRVVALKVLSPDLTRDSKFCDMFIKEARAAGSLNHPNIIQVYDVGEDNGNYYFSMEFASKGSVLDQLNKQKRAEVPHAVTIVKDTCKALDYAEKKGLVHRDIKPDNLMVTEDNSVKLGDLGLAMSAQELQGEQAGVFGTPHYIAPEQAMGKPIDHRADLYALGASFYRILTGQTLFQGASVKEILKKQVRDPHPPIANYLPDCPSGIVTIIDKMLAKTPAERYQHAADVLKDLENWENLISKRGGFNSAAFAAPPEARRQHAENNLAQAQKSKGLAIAALAAVGGIAVLLLALWLFVFNKPNTIAQNNNEPDQNMPANNAPPTNTPGVVVDKDVEYANSKIDEAVGTAKFMHRGIDGKGGTIEQLKNAVALLDKAMKENPKSTRLDVAKRLRTQIQDDIDKVMRETGDVDTAWELCQQKYLGEMDVYLYQAGERTLKAFVDDPRWANATNDHVKEVWGMAEVAWNTYWNKVEGRVGDIENEIKNARIEADKMNDRVAAIRQIEKSLERPRDMVTKCDDETRRKRIEGLIRGSEDRIKVYEDDIKNDATRRLNEAHKLCLASLKSDMLWVLNDIREGNFLAADNRMDNFEKNNKQLVEYRNDPLFADVLAEIRMRKNQTRLEFEAIRLIAQSPGGAVLPSFTEQSTLLRNKPLPKEAETLFGGKNVPIKLKISKATQENNLWFLESVMVGGQPRNLTCADFGPAGQYKPAGLAAGLVHVILNDSKTLARLQQPANTNNKDDPAALVGLWAWLAELGAGYEALPLIERAYEDAQKLPADSAVRKSTWEFMAYALLVRCDVETRAGRLEDAQKALDRFNSAEFEGCRARKK